MYYITVFQLYNTVIRVFKDIFTIGKKPSGMRCFN